jgi:apolipoprotein N-acyltransferase
LWAFLIALPILWTGLEYFRSELYYLKFAWLTPGLAFGKGLLVQSLGVYGTGFMTTAAGALAAILPPKKSLITGAILLALLALFTNIPADMPIYPNRNPIRVVLIQCEEPSLAMVRDALDTAISEHPDAALIIMSEYSLASPPTDALKNWCKSRGRTLIIGGMHFVDDTNTKYEDTAFVIDPTGSVVFTQGKSVPIQFFNDGLPAKEQHLWDSPWGKIGICICYDLSYTRVTDELIRQGAQLLIVPSMDAHHWGEYEHELHARIGPARAAEYGVPILRATSSGVSQIIRADGTTAASAAFSDQTAFISGELTIARKAHLPLDRYLAPICTVLTALIILCLLVSTLRRRLHKKASLAG